MSEFAVCLNNKSRKAYFQVRQIKHVDDLGAIQGRATEHIVYCSYTRRF
jgi:hypothetical protein